MKKGFLAFTLFILSSGSYACTGVDNPDLLASKLSVSDTSMSFKQEEGRGMITTMGSINSSASSCAQDLVIEIKYFDGSGKQIDVTAKALYDVVVPPGEKVAFRVQDAADKPKEAYVKSTVRVITAEPKYSAQPKQPKTSPLLEFLYSWGPMLLLIAVWIFAMRKYAGKKSPQHRSLLLVEEQVGVLKRQIDILERMATALEKRTTQ